MIWLRGRARRRLARQPPLLSACAVVLFPLLPTLLLATNRTWSNTGTDFNTGANWGGTAPGTNDVAVFSTAASKQPNLSASLTIQELNFSTTASSGYDLTSSSTSIKLTLTNTGTGSSGAINAANTSGTNTIDAPIILGAAASSTQTFTQASGGTLIINGVISNTNSNVTLSLTGGTIRLTGTNTYTGATTITAGIVNIQNASALGTTASGTTVSSGATLQLQNTITVGAEALTISGTGASGQTGALVNVSGTNSYGGLLTLAAATTISSDSGTLNLTNTGTITGSGFGLTLTGAGSGTVSSIIGTGAGTLIKSGTGTWTLTGADTYTGSTSISAGILNIQNATALGTTASGTTVSSGATLQLQGSISVGAEGLTLSGSGASGQNGALVNVSGTNSYGGLLTLAAATTISSDSGTLNLTNSGTITGATFNLTLTGSGSGSLSSIIGTTTGGLIKNGSGTWTLSGVGTYSGATTINAGTLSVSSLANGGSNSNIGSSSNAATNLIFNGGTLSYTGAAVSTDRLFSVGSSSGTLDASGSGAINFTNTGSMGFNSQTGTRTLTLTGTNTGNNTLAAVVGDNSGATSLVKSGAGTWILSGTNSYTGATTVNAGTLFVTGSTASGSAATVNNSGSVLGGTGTISGSVSIASSGAILEAGTGSTGQTLTMKGAVTMGTGSIIMLALGASSAKSILAIVGGTISFQSAQKFNIIDLGVTPGSTYTGIITGIGSNPGTEASWIITNQSWSYTFGYDALNGGEIDLTINPVPEPATCFAAALALLALIYNQRRRFLRSW